MTDLSKFRTLAKNWEALGETDPLFGVLSDPTKFGGKWNADEFFASGRAHIEKLLRTLADVRASFEPGECLDFGCGVGRLTLPLSESFRHTLGVDVAKPMIESARRHAPPGGRCEFAVNRDPDLRRFADNTFDVVHSCLVLQHIPPEISLRYIAEFVRVCRPGGLVVFQVPAVRWTEAEVTAAHALPDSAVTATITVVDPPATLAVSASAAVVLRITNHGDAVWRHDIPAGRHICVGNHWALADGTIVVSDDGRALLPHAVRPSETVEISLTVRAPESPGAYLIEFDLVQEHVCWFAQKGSPVARVAVTVTSAAPVTTVTTVTGPSRSTSGVSPASSAGPADSPGDVARQSQELAPRAPFVTRVLRRLRGGTPTFEMHVVSRADVEARVQTAGGVVIRAVDDNAAGPGWLSYTYVCRKAERD